MSIETKTRTIDGIDYRVTQLGAKQGRAIMVRLLQVVAPTLSKLSGANITKIEDIELSQIGPALEALVAHANEEVLGELCSAFASRSSFRDGQNWPELDRHFDMHFGGAYLRMFKWLVFSIEVNYADFFDAFREAQAKAAAKRAASESVSPTA